MSNNFRASFKIPGKTFLLGEYVALLGGPTLAVATNPQFEVNFSIDNFKNPFAPESPAGLYVKKHIEFFQNFAMEFVDPYVGVGGFGASTAQFLGVCAFHKKFDVLQKEQPFDFRSSEFVQSVWQEYRCLFVGTGVNPSGADLVAQLLGGISSWTSEPFKVENFEAFFDDVKIQLYKTPYKVKTHEHLEQINLEKLPISVLAECVQAALRGLRAKDFKLFRDASAEFSTMLMQNGLLREDSKELVQALEKTPGVLLARGCGALGADVIAVYTTSETKSLVSAFSQLSLIAEVPADQAYGAWVEVD